MSEKYCQFVGCHEPDVPIESGCSKYHLGCKYDAIQEVARRRGHIYRDRKKQIDKNYFTDKKRLGKSKKIPPLTEIQLNLINNATIHTSIQLSEVRTSAVYWLIYRGNKKYPGKSQNIFKRICEHRVQKERHTKEFIIFDSYSYIAWPSNDLVMFERQLYKHFNIVYPYHKNLD